MDDKSSNRRSEIHADLETDGRRSVLLEGLLKFVYANQGVGRLTKLGLPFPHFTAAFIGYLEIVGGLLLLSGLMTRLIAISFIIEMIVAYSRRKSRCISGHRH